TATTWRQMMQSSLLITALVLVGISAGCFITNCPPGGKRSSASNHMGHTKKCMPCGPGLSGRCIGTDICCNPGQGCFIGTLETQLCKMENSNPMRCSNDDLKPCGRTQDGKCAANGLCCTEVKCELDATCERETSLHNTVSRDILSRLSAQWNI
ncbi:unnamed protein product, partial [Meganyctiphanes norvegica]